MDGQVMEDLNEVTRKLELQDAQMSVITLRPQTSATSVDSGINSGIPSRNLSSSSLGHPDLPPEIFAPMEAIDESEQQNERPISPIITIEEPTTDEVELTRKSSFSESSHHLNIEAFQVRKGSIDSVGSEEYETPPTSPISRSISVESSASASSTPQEVRIKVQINLPTSNEVITVNTSAMIHRKLRQLQLNFFFTPTLSRHSPMQRCRSSPNMKFKHPSKSFDEESPKYLPNKKMLPSKSIDEAPTFPSKAFPLFYEESSPHSPCIVTKSDKSRRRFRNILIARIVRRNMVEFVDSTDIDTLCPHLYAKELLSHNDMEELTSIKSVRGKKNFLYMLLLDSKGVDAYQNLYDSLKEATQHCGHIDLVKIIDSGLKDQEYL